jgi:hypothetical protein
VPESFSFERGHVVDGEDVRSITLRYASAEDERLSVVVRPTLEYDYSESERYETVDIASESGYYTEYEFDGETTRMLVLPCEDDTYSIIGNSSNDVVTNVGESLTCE